MASHHAIPTKLMQSGAVDPNRSLVDETTLALHAKKRRKGSVISLNKSIWTQRIGGDTPFLYTRCARLVARYLDGRC